jgi:YaiO family outer membrane protein
LTTGFAQQKPDADALFLTARDAAFSERWSEARKICRELLSYYPEYYDATILMGRTYAQELKTDSARTVISPLLDMEADNYDVLTLLADNEIWGGQYDQALNFIDRALGFYPADEDFLYKKANTFYLKKDHPNAIRVLHELLTVNPDHANGNELLNTILPPRMFLDEIYARADGEAHAGNWKLARKYCRQVLAEDPDYFEASLLMAQTFAFENKFDSARIISARLRKANPRNYDVLDLMVNIEMWDRDYKTAASRVGRALAAYPNDENFLFKKAKIQYLAKDYTNALKTLNKLLKINPNHEEALALKNDILENHQYRDYVFVEDYFEFFKEPYLSRKLVTSTGISKWTRHGTYIAKVNMGEELPYKSLAFQYELEAYQQLFPTNYLYLDYAYSRNDFFPGHRGAVEFFQRLPKGFEASLGVRFLYWTDLTWIYTGSVSWLYNKNYLSFRPFFTYQNSRWIDSYNLTYRRYFTEKDDYVYAMVGYGNYSDDFIHLNPNPGSSYRVQVGILKFITVRWFFLASAGYAYDDGYRNRFQASAGVRYYFSMFK